ncbi:uncharacterized protein LOC127856589 isoform X2 [Dreissena polymorpha]|uniref:Chitin-binding type-2 domain-containing protein n=1 Tax=Dreissena polymorpha TaxID=45954 RepID=A0A9D4C2B9_DREPO|nr:uncharacterized protein LOC127856589 isoform X2 [Dreissena polymorpha]KAH3715884.1 hypothetical protein DPMN_058598 [Dreissena polymorpha]
MLHQVVFVCLLAVNIPGLKAGLAMMSPTADVVQTVVQTVDITDYNAACARANCLSPSTCYIAHPNDCFRFVICTPTERGGMHAQDMPCAFGTKWSSAEPGCGGYDIVDCMHDRCRSGDVSSYLHEDNNCRTYWRCANGRSVPACCEKYRKFVQINSTHGECVNDATCESVCPLMNDATCRSGIIQASNFPDGNCLTYWNCTSGHPHPVCCPQGQGFNVFTSACDRNTKCIDTCPKEYDDTCSKTGTTSYDLVDNNCRTYMKCGKSGLADPFCCMPGQEFSPTARGCVAARTASCALESCPLGYLEECRFEAIPGDVTMFKFIDAHGGTEMSCGVGTVFNISECQCVRDTRPTTSSPVGSCPMAIHFLPPGLKNRGSVTAALLMIGSHGQGETGVGNMTSVLWTGVDGINIPFYGSQDLWMFYLEVRVRPTAEPTVKQVLVSSCYYDGGMPSLEVSFPKAASPNMGNIMNIQVAGITFANISYNLNEDLVLKVIHTPSHVGVFMSQPGKPDVESIVPMSGPVIIDRGGLRFAQCRYEDGVKSFIGYVQEIKFSKCIPDIELSRFPK